MGAVRYSQFQLEKQFFSDLWAFRKKYYNGTGEPWEWWEELAKEADVLARKYPGTCQVKMVLACLEDIEARARGERN